MSVYLPIEHYDAFLALVRNREPTEALLVEGRKMTVSAWMPFPGL